MKMMGTPAFKSVEVAVASMELPISLEDFLRQAEPDTQELFSHSKIPPCK